MSSNTELANMLRAHRIMLNLAYPGEYVEQMAVLQEASDRLLDMDAGKVDGYLHKHPEFNSKGTYSRIPLTTLERLNGWTQTPLYAGQLRPDPKAQFTVEKSR